MVQTSLATRYVFKARRQAFIIGKSTHESSVDVEVDVWVDWGGVDMKGGGQYDDRDNV